VATSVSALFESISAAVLDLNRYGRPFAVVGGLAVSIRAEPRFTRDADLAVAVVDDDDAERLVAQLRAVGYGVAATVEQLATGRLATVRLQSRVADGVIVDLLFASSGIEAEITADADLLRVIGTLELPVATVGHLIALKLLSVDDDRRRRDAIDLDSLTTVADENDWAAATLACELIHERGYHRGRDLVGRLQELRMR
jgi:predicted nucleotidyltransferase